MLRLIFVRQGEGVVEEVIGGPLRPRRFACVPTEVHAWPSTQIGVGIRMPHALLAMFDRRFEAQALQDSTSDAEPMGHPEILGVKRVASFQQPSTV